MAGKNDIKRVGEIYRILNILTGKVYKWPHEKGVKCKCDECRRKWNDYLREWRASKKNDTFIEGNQR